ncbi:hypothetical protein VYU27_005294 [Nannochloropsis oceanica]
MHVYPKPVKSDVFTGTDVETCYSRLRDRVSLRRQMDFVSFSVDFPLQSCQAMNPTQAISSDVHECCGYLWTVQLVRLPDPATAPPHPPRSLPPPRPPGSNTADSTISPPPPPPSLPCSPRDRMGLWLHLLPMKPLPTSPFPRSKPRGVASMVQIKVKTKAGYFNMLPDHCHTWTVFGGKEGKDNIKFPYFHPENSPPLSEADLFRREREGVREWSQIVSADGGLFLAKPEEGQGHQGMRARCMTVKICVRTED